MKHWLAMIMYLTYLKYPIAPNRPVVWQEGKATKDTETDTETTPPPNVILILVDDLGFNDITFNGGGYYNGLVPTPHIDSLGHTGVSFSNAYAAHATCAPSRAAILTGQYPTKTGYEFTPTNEWGPYIMGKFLGKDSLKGIYHESSTGPVHHSKQVLPSNAVTIAEKIRDKYHTIHIGKWHLGFTNTSIPSARGFDESLNSGSGTLYLPPHHPDIQNCEVDHMMDTFIWACVRYEVRTEHNQSEGGRKTFEPDGYVTDYQAKEAAKAITANKHNPFFLYLALTSVHTPLQALKSDYDQLMHIPSHCDRVYAAMLISLDRAVGTILAALAVNNLTDNTIVMFTSDNGGPNYIGQPNINFPYRGSKATFFEGGLRVPFFIKYPRVIAPGTVINTTVSHVDIFPTVLAAAGMTFEPDAIDGRDIFSLIDGAKPTPTGGAAEPVPLSDRVQLGEQQEQHVQQQDEKSQKEEDDNDYDVKKEELETPKKIKTVTEDFHETLFWRSGHYKALRKGPWKLQVSGNPKMMWLFDLAHDPTEQNNLASSELSAHVTVLKDMLSELERENAQQVEPLWPSLSETPLLIDKQLTKESHYVEGEDEYVYWPN